jgi:hypothetical protein
MVSHMICYINIPKALKMPLLNDSEKIQQNVFQKNLIFVVSLVISVVSNTGFLDFHFLDEPDMLERFQKKFWSFAF